MLLVVALLLLGMLLPGATSQAAGNLSITRTIQPPSADAYLYNLRPEYNYGGATKLAVTAKSDKTSRSILKFATGIPSGSTVSSATLSLYYYAVQKDAAGRTYWAYRITQTDWVEGTSNDVTEAGASDWNHRQHDTLSWSSAGGTYTETDGVSTTVPASYAWMEWAVTAQVQYAITNGVDAYFLIRDSAETADTGSYFYSKEEATQTTLRPKLSITFTAPWDSYEDSGRTTIRDTFNGSYKTVYMKGMGFASGNYNVAYYDGGASGGQKVTTDPNVGVSGDGVLNSAITLPAYPSSTAGTWHALVQPSGATAFPTNYNDAVAAPDTYDLIANDSFTVDQSAIDNSNPTVDAVGIYETNHSTAVTTMTPQTEHAVKVTVTDNDTLNDLSTIKVTIFYDSDGDNDPADVPASGDTQNAAILTCTVGATPSWQIDPSASTTWQLVTANCVQPTLTNSTGDFWFHFKPGKVATKALDWDAYAVADDGGGTPGTLYDSSGYDMNWYGEITVNTSGVDWGNVGLGSGFTDDTTNRVNASVTYICNGNYNKQIKASSPWGTSPTVALNPSGTPGDDEFSLRADDDLTLDGAVLVSTAYATFGTGTQTDEGGATEVNNGIWLKTGPSGITGGVAYDGTIYYAITQQ